MWVRIIPEPLTLKVKSGFVALTDQQARRPSSGNGLWLALYERPRCRFISIRAGAIVITRRALIYETLYIRRIAVRLKCESHWRVTVQHYDDVIVDLSNMHPSRDHDTRDASMGVSAPVLQYRRNTHSLPVQYALASLASHTTAPPISLGSPGLMRGISWAQASGGMLVIRSFVILYK